MVEVKNVLLSINKDKPPGTDNLDGKLLKLVKEYIVSPVCHIFNIEDGVCPQAWREVKIILLPKNSKAPCRFSNRRPMSLLPLLSKLLEKNLYFTENQLTTYL